MLMVIFSAGCYLQARSSSGYDLGGEETEILEIEIFYTLEGEIGGGA
jgi:hypothetical protein